MSILSSKLVEGLRGGNPTFHYTDRHNIPDGFADSSKAGYISANAKLFNVIGRINQELGSAKTPILDAFGADAVARGLIKATELLKSAKPLAESMEYTSVFSTPPQKSVSDLYAQAAKALHRYWSINTDEQSIADWLKSLEPSEDGDSDDGGEDGDGDGSGSGGGGVNLDVDLGDDWVHESSIVDGPTGEKSKFPFPMNDFALFILSSMDEFEVMSRQIDSVQALSVVRESDTFLDPDGEERIRRPFDLAKITRMDMNGWIAAGLPIPAYFPLTMDEYSVYENASTTSRRQIEVIVLDSSGSMMGNRRALRAGAYIVNRMNKVIDGLSAVACVVFDESATLLRLGAAVVAGYDDDDESNASDESPAVVPEPENSLANSPGREWVIDSPELAQRAKLHFTRKYAERLGGGTNIRDAIILADKVASAMKELYPQADRPHITLITDEAGMNPLPLDVQKRNVINALVVMQNGGLQQLCYQTGGTYLPLNVIK